MSTMPNDKERGEPVQILLVEDNPDDVFLMEKSLRRGRLTNTLHVAEDGEQAVDFLNRRGKFKDAPRPDLILLDLNLPGMDGRQVLSYIKQSEDFREIPVVILTTSDSDKDVLESYRAHANSYLTKPVDFHQFVELVRSVTEYWFTLVKLPPKPKE